MTQTASEWQVKKWSKKGRSITKTFLFSIPERIGFSGKERIMYLAKYKDWMSAVLCMYKGRVSHTEQEHMHSDFPASSLSGSVPPTTGTAAGGTANPAISASTRRFRPSFILRFWDWSLRLLDFLSYGCWQLSAHLHNRNIKWFYMQTTGFFPHLSLHIRLYMKPYRGLQTRLSACCGKKGKILDNMTASLVFVTSFAAAEAKSKL